MAIKQKCEKGFIRLPINMLVKAEWNYKTNDESKASKLAANIKRNGQVENIIVRQISKAKYEIVNGNHRLDAFVSAAIDEPMVFNLGKISLAEAQRVAIETNETRFENDHIKLAEIISGLIGDFTIDDLAETMPYSPDEIEGFQKLLDFEWSQFDNKGGNGADGDGGDNPVFISQPTDTWLLGVHVLVVGDGDNTALSADAAIRAWQKFTGDEAILEATGQTFLQVSAVRGTKNE